MKRLLWGIILCLVCSCSPSEDGGNEDKEPYDAPYLRPSAEDMAAIGADHYEEWVQHSDVIEEVTVSREK